MGEKTKILFYVCYGLKECSLELWEYSTVGDLKNEIHRTCGIAPHKQKIESWHKEPRTDSSTLKTCCVRDDCNYLVVFNIEDYSRDSAKEFEHFDSLSTTENAETSSIWSFKEYFSSNFQYVGIKFPLCTLQEAAQKVNTHKKRILILYFHNKKDTFANFFCKQLTGDDVQKLLNDHFFLLCWDIEKDEYQAGLVEALRQHPEIRSFEEYITSKSSCALFIAPLDNGLEVINVLRYGISELDFLSTLENAKEIFIEEEEIKNNQVEKYERYTFGSREYQQHMLNMLGDRDYNSYDYFEHEYLKQDIGFSFFGPPQQEQGYVDKQKAKIETIFNKILEENNRIAKWKDRVQISFIYICMEPLQDEKAKRAKKYKDYDPNSDLTPIPVFVLRKCKNSDEPCRIFIDDIGRVYETWKRYLENNKLPECEMVFPKNGRYEADDNGDVQLDRKLSPACDISNSVLLGTDIASTVGGIASGGVMIAASAIPAVAAAPFVLPVAVVAGVATGIYSIGRSASVIHDRMIHRENLNFFESSEARGAYINIVAGSLGFVGTGANLVVSKLAAAGFNIAEGATAAVNTINIVNLGIGGVGLASATYDVIRNFVEENERPSLLTIVQLSSSVLFFGHAVYNYRSFSTVIEEAQTNTLKEYQESLRSNRHRKAFTKLLKETIRQNDGNVQSGRAEVISTIRNIQNKDEVFAVLTRANKAMNDRNVRFAASNGELTLNGVAVDMTQLVNMQKNEVVTFLKQLPGKPNPSVSDIRNMTTYIDSSFRGIPCGEIASLAMNLAKIFFGADSTIQEKIVKTVAAIIRHFTVDPLDTIMKTLDTLFPGHNKIIRLFDMVNKFFQDLINEAEEQYRKWDETHDPIYKKPYFDLLAHLDTAKRVSTFFDEVTKTYYIGTNLTDIGLEKLLNHFYTWFAYQLAVYENNQKRIRDRRGHSAAAGKQGCTICGGQFYSST